MSRKYKGIFKAKWSVIYINPNWAGNSRIFQKKKGLFSTIGRKSLRFTYKIKKTTFFGHFSNNLSQIPAISRFEWDFLEKRVFLTILQTILALFWPPQGPPGRGGTPPQKGGYTPPSRGGDHPVPGKTDFLRFWPKKHEKTQMFSGSYGPAPQGPWLYGSRGTRGGPPTGGTLRVSLIL